MYVKKKKRNFLWELLHMKPQSIGRVKKRKLEMVEI